MEILYSYSIHSTIFLEFVAGFSHAYWGTYVYSLFFQEQAQEQELHGEPDTTPEEEIINLQQTATVVDIHITDYYSPEEDILMTDTDDTTPLLLPRPTWHSAAKNKVGNDHHN